MADKANSIFNPNSNFWKTFRRIMPWKLRLVVGYVLWFFLVLPVYVGEGMIRGAKDAHDDLKTAIKKAKNVCDFLKFITSFNKRKKEKIRKVKNAYFLLFRRLKTPLVSFRSFPGGHWHFGLFQLFIIRDPRFPYLNVMRRPFPWSSKGLSHSKMYTFHIKWRKG
jgi:hypothetical protein